MHSIRVEENRWWDAHTEQNRELARRTDKSIVSGIYGDCGKVQIAIERSKGEVVKAPPI